MLNDEEDDVEDEESDDEYEKYDVVLKEIGEESGLGRSNKYWWENPPGEKSDINEDYDESDNESDVGIDYEDDEDNDKDDDDNDDVRDYADLQISDILCTIISGRTCRTWEARYLFANNCLTILSWGRVAIFFNGVKPIVGGF